MPRAAAKRRLPDQQHRRVKRRLSQTEFTDLQTHTQGPFILAGPVGHPDARSVPLRGDLAHVGLAGRYFVPHYAVPQPRSVMPGGAPLQTEPNDLSAEVCILMEGDSFEVLDIVGTWAWGCMSLHGPVGYVHLDRLEPAAG